MAFALELVPAFEIGDDGVQIIGYSLPRAGITFWNGYRLSSAPVDKYIRIRYVIDGAD